MPRAIFKSDVCTTKSTVMTVNMLLKAIIWEKEGKYVYKIRRNSHFFLLLSFKWQSFNYFSVHVIIHDKTNKMTVRPAKTQISQGIRSVWVFAVRMKKALVLSYPLSAQRRLWLWPTWTDVQADLSLRRAHRHFVGFVIRRLIYWWSCQSESFCRKPHTKFQHVAELCQLRVKY